MLFTLKKNLGYRRSYAFPRRIRSLEGDRMRPVVGLPRVKRASVAILAATFVCVALAGLQGCKGKDTPNLSTKGLVVESTGTVQAPLSVEASGPTSADVPTSSAADAANALAAAQSPKVATIWPAKVGAFAKSFKGPVWYPKTTPKGFKVDSLDIVELEPGSGLICDIVYVSGEKSVGFTQGSPKTRDYEIVSTGKVPWGTDTADVVLEDPADPKSPQMIVYNKGGNFAELYGDASFAELKAMAASMVAVK
jgi:hypothetical protein